VYEDEGYLPVPTKRLKGQLSEDIELIMNIVIFENGNATGKTISPFYVDCIMPILLWQENSEFET
jgi:hypothetical protein